MSSFYAVANGRKIGVFTDWIECKNQTDGFDNPIFKKFDNHSDAAAFVESFSETIYVYTDGACINNGEDNARAGIGIYFSKNNPQNLSKELISSDFKSKLTNNIAELMAAIEAIKIIKDTPFKNKIIVSDSEYMIKCATTYGKKLEANDWKTTNDKKPPNLELVKFLYELTNTYNIKYKHVMAHTDNKDRHSIGNYYADKYANNSIDNRTEKKDDSSNNTKIYLNVAYKDKDDAKSKGARWDPNKKKWYILDNNTNKEELVRKYK
jgi:ribonuclease HI